MSEWDPLRMEYTTVAELIDYITYTVESISLGFDRWDEQYIRGPGLYFVVVTGVHAGGYADPLGENKWPVETCRLVTENLDGFVQAGETVGHTRDGAVIISTDGTVQEQMVRIKSQDQGETQSSEEKTIEYADWMGTKHLSAIEVSVREEVVGAITLSEEEDRMSVFEDGTYDDYQRDELGGVGGRQTELRTSSDIATRRSHSAAGRELGMGSTEYPIRRACSWCAQARTLPLHLCRLLRNATESDIFRSNEATATRQRIPGKT